MPYFPLITLLVTSWEFLGVMVLSVAATVRTSPVMVAFCVTWMVL